MATVTDDHPPAPPHGTVDPDAARRHWRSTLRLTAALLAVWFGVGFVVPWFARDLDFAFFGWPFSFWVAAQGGTCVFVALIVVYAAWMKRLDRGLARTREPAGEATPDPRGADRRAR